MTSVMQEIQIAQKIAQIGYSSVLAGKTRLFIFLLQHKQASLQVCHINLTDAQC